jgi:hypothetical protein
VPRCGRNRESRENRERSRRCNPTPEECLVKPALKSGNCFDNPRPLFCSQGWEGRRSGRGESEDLPCRITPALRRLNACGENACHRPVVGLSMADASTGCRKRVQPFEPTGLKGCLVWCAAGPVSKQGIFDHQQDASSTGRVANASIHERRFRCQKFTARRTQGGGRMPQIT